MRNAWLRIAIMFAWIPIAFGVGLAFHSQKAFVAVIALGFVVGIVLRRTVLR